MIQRRPKIPEETMKTATLTPISSVNSTTTTENNPSETRDGSYFPGCRKDANCNCDICIASINATLDLIPRSSHRSSLTKFSTSRPVIPRSPIPFTSSADLSTPKSSARIWPVTMSPPLNPSAKVDFEEKMKSRKWDLAYGVFVVRVLLGLILVCCVDYGISRVVPGVLKARLSTDIVKNLSEKSWNFEGLNGRFMFLKNELEGLVGNKVSSCSSPDSVWKINQDGLLLNSRCILYKSMTEEVSIWGWPLQTAGILTTEYSSLSLSIISGRLTEWSTWETKYSVREANSSWIQGKWSSSVVQFDSNTWILEYKKSFLSDNSRMVFALVEFLKFRVIIEFEKMKQEFWLPFVFGRRRRRSSDFTEGRILIPT